MHVNPKWFKLFGLLLDIVGTVIIGFGVLNMNTHFRGLSNNQQRSHTTREFEDDVEEQLQRENSYTAIGIALIFVGFVFIFGEEAYTSMWKK